MHHSPSRRNFILAAALAAASPMVGLAQTARAPAPRPTGLVLGVFTGNLQAGAGANLKRFIPLASYLGSESRVPLVFLPEPDGGHYRRRIAERFYPVVFVSPEIGASASLAGYVPLARRTDTFTGVLAARAKVEASDIAGFLASTGKVCRIGVEERTAGAHLIRASLIRAKALDRVRFFDEPQAGLPALLESGKVDGVVMASDASSSMLAATGEKHRVVTKLGDVPGPLLMAHPEQVDAPTRVALASAMTRLDPSTPAGGAVLVPGARFAQASADDLRDYVAMLDAVSRATGDKSLLMRPRGGPAAAGRKG